MTRRKPPEAIPRKERGHRGGKEAGTQGGVRGGAVTGSGLVVLESMWC